MHHCHVPQRAWQLHLNWRIGTSFDVGRVVDPTANKQRSAKGQTDDCEWVFHDWGVEVCRLYRACPITVPQG